MSAVLQLTLSKSSYNVGEAMVLTVAHRPPRHSYIDPPTPTPRPGRNPGVRELVDRLIVDDPGMDWTLVYHDGRTCKYTATAQTSGTATVHQLFLGGAHTATATYTVTAPPAH